MASTTVVTEGRKSALGANSIVTDLAGTNATFPVEKSDGEFRNDRALNATHIPITTTARSKTLITGATSASVDVNASIVELYDGVVLALPKAGGTMTGDLNMGSQDITAVNQLSMLGGGSGVDMNNTPISEVSLLSMQAGGSGVDMNSTKVTDLADGTASGDALNAGQIDGVHITLNGSNQLTVPDNGIGIEELNMDGGGATFSHFIISAQRYVLTGGTVTEDCSGFSGLATGMLVTATFNLNTSSRRIITADVKNAMEVTVVFDVAPAANDIITIVVYKATQAL